LEYLTYFLSKLFDGLENFFKSFTIVSGRATLRVFYFSLIYLGIAIISKLTGLYTFLDVWSALLAVGVLLLINCISVIQRKDIEKFKKLLKGDANDQE
jgi:low affinity Fe/Cu permease